MLFNGAIECRLLEIPVHGSAESSSGAGPSWRKPSEKAQMFANRIKKNNKKWRRWAKRNGICTEVFEKGKRFRQMANGYALGSGNSIPDYVPVEGYLAMVQAAQDIRALA